MENGNKVTGLVMEGGAMRGLFTCGVIDVFMEQGICFDKAVGVSAGAAFGCNFKSKQIGRPRRYNEKYCSDKRYASWSSWLRTGDLFNVKFCYETLPFELDPWDTEAFVNDPMEFYCVATDASTGKPVYHKCEDGGREDIRWIRASASMPVFSNPVEIDGGFYMDGGTSDPIPLAFAERLGCERIVVIETQPKGYVKQKQKYLPVIRKALKDFPNLVKALERRHILYNREKVYIREKEAKGEVFVIRPAHPLHIKSSEKNPSELERVYQEGRRAAEELLDKMVGWIEEGKNRG